MIGGSLAVAAAGLALMTWTGTDSGLAGLMIGFVLLFGGPAPAGGLGTDMIIGAAPPERAGAASAVSETGNELGGALGLAVLGSIGTAVYRGEVGDSIPAGVPPEAAGTGRDTLAGATSAAEQLPAGLGDALLGTARDAFIQGLQVTAGVGAAIVIAAAVFATVLLRNLRPPSEAEPEHATSP